MDVEETEEPQGSPGAKEETDWLFEAQQRVAGLGLALPALGGQEPKPTIEYRIKDETPGSPPAKPKIKKKVSGRNTVADRSYPVLTQQAIATRTKKGSFEGTVDCSLSGTAVNVSAVSGSQHKVTAQSVKAIGVVVDLRGIRNKLAVIHLGAAHITVTAISGNNNDVRAELIQAIGVRVKLDLGSGTHVVLSGGKLSVAAVAGTANYVECNELSAVGVLLEYYSHGKPVQRTPLAGALAATTAGMPGVATPVAIQFT
ncbi:putative hypothetical protein [Streptomyces sp. NBRC 110611]|uniref:hypothetical protein n=1 Tax=Streptomyces sp. NBRC 110611 TaxID=1621259 RepID=UPI0008563147|nr:hypothetical protein [Streptomyces sp. NBRC 110611]GAU70211.1 putative hypothetical protein [Streptomyces sp. NBRC 110611]